MNFKLLAISILLVSLISLGALSFMSDISIKYGAEMPENYLTNKSRLETRLEVQQNLSSELNSTVMSMTLESPATVVLVPYKMIKTGWTVMKLIFNSIWTIEASLLDLGDASASSGIPLPPYVIPIIISILIIIVVIIIVEAFTRWKLQS